MSIPIQGSSSYSTSTDALPLEVDVSSDSLFDQAFGDPITEVAVLLAQSFREERKQALEASDAAEAARVGAVEQQVQEVRERADSLRDAGWIRGATLAVSGGAAVAGAILSIGKSDETTDRLSTGFTGGGKLVEGVGMGFGGSYESAADKHQGEAHLHEGRADAYKVASERHRDEADEAQRMTRKVMDFLENVKQSRDAAENAASGIRG
jgi:hypothetical protein